MSPSNLHHLSQALEHEWPAYLAYVTSFLTIGRVWIAHHRLFGGLRVVDTMMMRLNLLLLMTTGFLPFPTGSLAESLRAPDQTAETALVYLTLAIHGMLLIESHRRNVRSSKPA